MLDTARFVATLASALFAGAAVYINLVEHPARMSCGIQVALAVWAPSYARAAVVQASLALVSFLSGVLSWWLADDTWWLVGALVMIAVVPFTLLVVAPVNHALLAPTRDPASPDTRILLERWARLHAVRSALGLIAAGIFLTRLLR